LTAEQEQSFRDGLPIEGRRTAPAGLRLAHRAANPWYEVRLFEGRKNQIRLMFKHSGRLVEKLKRVKIGPLALGTLKPGEFRYLSQPEVEQLRKAVKHSGAKHAAVNHTAVKHLVVKPVTTSRKRMKEEVPAVSAFRR